MNGPSPWSLRQRAQKRGLDLFVSCAALVVLGPAMVGIGLLVRATSPGPALFKQERIGRGGRPFRIWKFRTMVDGAAHKGPAVTAAGDPRVTRLGRILRKTKLDELPQLVNVFRGDMSLVGPRPEVPRYVRTYDDQQRRVLLVRPGITDLASIEYRDEESVLAHYTDREAAYVKVLLPRKLSLAQEYVRKQSCLGDIQLLLRTFAVVLLG